MEKKNKIIFKITVLLIIIISMLTYYNIFILHNYSISFEVPCDPNTESCFAAKCDLTYNDNCSLGTFYYYKLIEKKASDAMICDSENFECLACKENEKKCSVILCDPQDEESICSNI